MAQQHPRGVILLGHGSRDPNWRRPIEAVADRLMRRHPGLAVRCAYLELEAPDLVTAGSALVALGADPVTVVPMFLGTGKHGREDPPALIELLRRTYPGVRFHLREAVGEDSRVLDLLADIAAE